MIPSDQKTDRSLHRRALPCFLLPGLLALAGCNQGYSPNTYAASAAQEEAAVQRGIIVGVRQVTISANGTIGAAAGGAAGGVAGAQAAGGPVVTALGAIGGSLVGGIGGTAAAQAVADTKGWEYIVQEEPGDKLVSVTQTSKTPLPLGLNVLVIAGTQQARIVPDYTVAIAPAPAAPAKPAAPGPPATFEVDISPVLPAAGTAPAPAAPITVAGDPAAPPAPAPRSGQPMTAEAANNESAATPTPAAAPSAQVTSAAGAAAP